MALISPPASSVGTCVIGGGALDEPAGALLPGEVAIADDDRPPRQDDVAATLDRPALVARVVDVHVVGPRRDRPLAVRVVDDDVRVRADRDSALPRVHPE